MNVDEPIENFNDRFDLHYNKNGISLVNLLNTYVDAILVYSFEGKLIYSEKPTQIKEIYNLTNLPKAGILVVTFGESRYVKKFLR